MIIPIAFEVSKKEEFEDYTIGLKYGVIVSDPPDMRVTVKLFDTQTRRGMGFSARVLIDPDVEPYHGMMTMFQMNGVSDDSREYLIALRDAINAALEENK